MLPRVAEPIRVVRLCSVFEPPPSALAGRGARFDPIGGMQEHTGSLTRALARRGLVQVVLTTRPPTAPRRERFAPQATVVRVGLPIPHARQFYAVPAAGMAPLLGMGADIVHAHLGEDLAILPLAALAARPRRLPIVVTVHTSLAHTLAPCDARGALLRRLGGWLERRAERDAAATLVYTARMAERLADASADCRVHIIRRGVDRAAFDEPGAPFLPELSDRPRVVFLGRLARQKGVLPLVEAFARVRTPGAQLLLVGDGPQRADVERLVERLGLAKRVRVCGFVPHDRVPAVLASADLMVLPAIYEELGTVLIEAMQAGIPVVASHVGGIPEVVQHGITGLLTPPGDVEALAAAIDEVLCDPALAVRLGAAARLRAPQHDLEHVADAVHVLYASLVDGRPRRPMGTAPVPWPA
jgi:glycogen synthase